MNDSLKTGVSVYVNWSLSFTFFAGPDQCSDANISMRQQYPATWQVCHASCSVCTASRVLSAVAADGLSVAASMVGLFRVKVERAKTHVRQVVVSTDKSVNRTVDPHPSCKCSNS